MMCAAEITKNAVRRLKNAEAWLVKLEQVGISLPVDFEKQTGIRSRRAEKYALGRSR